jgi:hypothetical protein
MLHTKYPSFGQKRIVVTHERPNGSQKNNSYQYMPIEVHEALYIFTKLQMMYFTLKFLNRKYSRIEQSATSNIVHNTNTTLT